MGLDALIAINKKAVRVFLFFCYELLEFGQ